METRIFERYGREPIVRLLKDDRPPPRDPEEELKIRTELDSQVSPINQKLRMQGSRIRVEIVDAGPSEAIDFVDQETGRRYRALLLY
ncbi:hypothetical protein DDW44_00025 [Streptomyces tirandamycinicus]|uniref:Uncharacterized protein n=1 Tax=Streptomyces tirandamycinicus TaxID=2174846 RepID=A0A2S1SLW5_9ACTN|nr:hypothetical protein DDW44_00025 [Streptomyces tirandamycinicus]